MATDMQGEPLSRSAELNGQLGFNTDHGNSLLHRTDGKAATLPGQPRVELSGSALSTYLSDHLLVPELNKAAPWLWLVGTPRSTHISPLHHQAVRGRSITLTENPQLHLIWHYKQIFVKPLPAYLLSFAFWQYLNTQPPQLKEAAIGFMRTYAWLVQYESDFAIAIDKGLIPNTKSINDENGETEELTYEDFCKLISSFARIGDGMVAPRYSYGELRLTRLNFYARIFMKKWTYHHIEAQWGTFFGSFLAPFVIIFGVSTTLLSATQVELNVIQSERNGVAGLSDGQTAFINYAKWCGVVVLCFVAFVVMLVTVTMLVMFVHDQYFAIRILKHKKNSESTKWRTRKSGVV